MGTSIFQEPPARYEKILLVSTVMLSVILFAYGLWALVFGICHVVGRGNAPIGTVVAFYGLEARFLSNLYTGGGILVFAMGFLSKLHYTITWQRYSKSLSWVGVILLAFGVCALAVILCLPLFK